MRRTIEPAVTRRDLHDRAQPDNAYWASRTVEERISHVTDLRSEAYGFDDATESRLQRVCRRVR